jgi:type I restriction enzyme M protein
VITGTLRSQIDKLWDDMWTGGIANPLTAIEQITFLMFARLLDLAATREEKKAARTGQKAKTPFTGPDDKRRWQNFRRLGGAQMLPVVRDEVFPLFRKMCEKSNGERTALGRYLQDANLLIQKPGLLVSAVEMIEQLPLERGDVKGDVYEYLLKKLTTAGINGQFRTPRHIIRLMVDLVEPQPEWRIGDPACGTGGFLIAVMEHLLQHWSSKQGTLPQLDESGEPVLNDDGQPALIYTGDKLEPYRKHIAADMFYGFDFDVTMLRIAAMNLMLHGVENPHIYYQDTLSNSFPDSTTPEVRRAASDHFDLILANPPFKGSLDEPDVHKSLTGKVKTRKTELLFLVLMLRMLKLGGRCGVIVPDGVLFGSSTAHRTLRKILVDDNQLDAVIKLPAGVFRPYAGVSTAVLLFTKGGKTEHVWFYDVVNDGFSLDDKRDPIEATDLPDVRARWAKRNPKKDTDRKDKAFFVPLGDIREANYDLSITRYKETVYEEPNYDPPKTILKRLKKLNEQEARNLSELEGMLR